jgi:peptide/nickel transport system permease protein
VRGRIPFAILAVLAIACFVTPGILGLDPFAIEPSAIYAPPSFSHLFGTDDLGRDVFARLLYGGRISLAVALLATAASVAIGGAIGIAGGYFGGAVDAISARVTEAMIALPKLPFMMLIAAIPLSTTGPSAQVLKMTAIIVLFGWTGAARLARAVSLQTREMDFVRASRALGASDMFILRKHILPAAMPSLLVAAAVDVGELVVYESALSFLGLGVQPPVPSWGAMLASGLTHVYSAPLIVILPGLLTFLTVASANRLADALRDVLDPRVAAATK